MSFSYNIQREDKGQ